MTYLLWRAIDFDKINDSLLRDGLQPQNVWPQETSVTGYMHLPWRTDNPLPQTRDLSGREYLEMAAQHRAFLPQVMEWSRVAGDVTAIPPSGQ